ncbi:MAG: DUF6364 family protein [Gemmatimonadaceae bacterium]
MPKVTKNLSLDEAAVVRGESYSRRHRTTLSRLVSDFLARLPYGEREADLTPAVRRLFGVAENHATSAGREDYREHLSKKYGGAKKRR